ncbi:hypothetical protein ABNF65_24310 [Paenibacillus larvae]
MEVVNAGGTEVKCIFDCERKQDFVSLFRSRESNLEVTYRSSDWDACSLMEAKDYINSQFTDTPVTEENYLNYCTITGFELTTNG